MAAEVVRAKHNTRIAATVFAVGWFFAAGGTVGLMAWMGLWTLVVLAGLMAFAVLVVAVRAARVRLEIHPDRLVVANHIRTHRIAAGDVRDVVAVAWDNPFGDSITVGVCVPGAPDDTVVRIEVLAVPAGHDDDLDAWLDRLDDWRFHRPRRA